MGGAKSYQPWLTSRATPLLNKLGHSVLLSAILSKESSGLGWVRVQGAE